MLGQTITGDANDNDLVGGDGDDNILGLGGDDTLTGALGDDRLDGGEGVDTAAFNDIDVPVTVALAADGSGTATRETGVSISYDDVPVEPLNAIDFVAEAEAGNLYFNVHTNDFNGGEIRGQLDTIASDVPTEGGGRVLTLTAQLDAAQEPGPTSDSEATGEATVVITVAADGSITYSTDLSITGLATSDLLPVAGVSSIHLHNAPRGANGPVILDVVQDAGGAINGEALSSEADTGDGDVFLEVIETDTLISIENIIGSNNNDEIIATGGAPNTIDGGAGDDFIAGGGGTDVLDGGEGVDVNSFSTIGVGVVADLGTGSASYQTGGGTTIFENFSNFEGLDGSEQDDQLFGDGAGNALTGNGGDDLLSGRGGADTLEGGEGDDVLQGGGGSDQLDGGEGIDTADFQDIMVGAEDPAASGVTGVLDTGTVSYTAPNGNIVTDTLENIENLTGSTNDDNLTGDDNANVIAGAAGDDTLSGGAGDDVIIGDGVGAGEAFTVTVENLAGEGGTFLTPLWFGFHDGANFDLFNEGEAASLGLERIAEDGSVEGIAAEFNQQVQGAGVDATIIGGQGAPGPIDPGETASFTLNIDPGQVGQGFFTWATMVIPSNDAFFAVPDNAFADPLFDEDGNFNGPLIIERRGSDVLDAGTEVNNEEGAAFLNQTARDQGTVENGVVGAHPGFNGSVGNPDGAPVNVLGGATAAGTIIDPVVGDFTANDDVLLRITIDRAVGGDDVLDGGAGADTLNGDVGDDILISDGLDELDGGEGVDTADFSGFAAGTIQNSPSGFDGVIVDLDVDSAGAAGTPGQRGAVLNSPPGAVAVGGVVPAANQIQSVNDVENLIGSAFNDGLFGNNEVNVIDAGAGNDVVHGFGGGDFLNGGEGLDTILFSASPTGVSVDLGAQVSAEDFDAIAEAGTGPTASAGGAGADVLAGFENVTGSQSDDVLIGDDIANTLIGQDGDDNLIGRGGDDRLTGGAGEDVLSGGAGADTLLGGADDDVLTGNGGDDRLIGNGGADVITGGAGADFVRGGGGEDGIRGGAGADQLLGNGGADALRGGSGQDVLNGGNGADVLLGNSGADRLIGGRGDDALTGGIGSDTFVFGAATGSDVVTDFGVNDFIEVTAGASEFDDLEIDDVEVGALVSFGQSSVLLLDVDADNLNAGDFVFS